MSNWPLAIIGAILIAMLLSGYKKHEECAAKGGALTRYGDCVRLVK